MEFKKLRWGWIIVLSVALSAPTIFHGFVVDDPLILSVLEERYPERPHAFDIYSVLLHQAELAWWNDPSTEMHFFRPLGSALLRLDHKMFGRWAPGWHLHSLLWLVVFLSLVAMLYRRIDPDSDADLAFWAFALLAVDESFAYTAGWISNRHALVALTFGVGALWAHLRWREDDWRPGLPLAVLGFTLSLLTAETGLAPLAYVGAYELFAGPGGPRRRILGLAPPLIVGLAYVIWYRVMGYGYHGEPGIYIDPGLQPLHFAAEATTRIPALLASGIFGVPADSWMRSEARPYLVVLGVFGLFSALLLVRRSRSESLRRRLVWPAMGALAACVPLAAVYPSNRQMGGPLLGLAPLVIVVLQILCAEAKRRTGIRKIVAAAFAVGLIAMHGMFSPFLRVVIPQGMAQMQQDMNRMLESVPGWDPEDGFQEIVVLQSPEMFSAFYGPTLLDHRLGTNRGDWAVLSGAPFDHRWTRTGPDELVLEIIDGEMLTTFPENAWSTRADLAEAEIEYDGIQIRVLESGKKGPRIVRFAFSRSLDDPALLLLNWGAAGEDRAFLPWTPPPMGESVTVPYFPGYVRLPFSAQ